MPDVQRLHARERQLTSEVFETHEKRKEKEEEEEKRTEEEKEDTRGQKEKKQRKAKARCLLGSRRALNASQQPYTLKV